MSDSGVIKKPELRGLLRRSIKRNLALAMVSVVTVGCYMRFIYGDGNKKKYADFYKTYDIEKVFERQRKKGLYDSCDTD